MNCKDNDVAMILKGNVQSNLGTIVQCKRRIGVHAYFIVDWEEGNQYLGN